jgi:hypothetical protein
MRDSAAGATGSKASYLHLAPETSAAAKANPFRRTAQDIAPEIHTRMPITLNSEERDARLRASNDLDLGAGAQLRHYPVARFAIEDDGEELIEALDARALGSRLVLFHSQNRTVAVRAIAEKKVSGQRSYRVATRLQSLSLPNMISIRLRRLYRRLSYLTGFLRDFRPGSRPLSPCLSKHL